MFQLLTKYCTIKEVIGMDNFVITIARGFGSGGKQIGLALSKQLGIPCYESQILSMASNYSGINKDLFFQVDEKLRGYHLIKRLMKSANKDDIVEPTDKSFISDVNLYNIQAKIIKELAKQQSCIIIGKCANHLLRDYDNTVSVYIEAPRAFCVKNVIERLGVTEEEAHRMIYQTSYFSRPCNNLRTYEGHKHGSRRVCDDRRIYNICRSADIRKILSRKHS